MRYITIGLRFTVVGLFTLAIGLAAVSAFGQKTDVRDKFKEKEAKMKERGFCNSGWSGDEHVSASDLREMTLPFRGSLNVDGRQNGGISIKGEDRSDVLIRACVQGWGSTEEAAKALVAGIKIETDGAVTATGPEEDHNWSVSFEIHTPRNTNLELTAHNGGISISAIDGNAEFTTSNGGIFLSDDAGSFKGRTTNGGVFARLSGSSWNGSGLDVVTTNGGVNIEMPETFAAHIETSTVNGGFSSSIPALAVTRDDRSGSWAYRTRTTKISTDINGGGAPIRISTTNGGVRIGTPGSEND